MNCHKLIYKPHRKTAPYQDFIRRQKQRQQQKKKQFLYEQILKYRESRYPLQFLKLLQTQINPFELSLDKLKQLFTIKHPQYSNQLVNQSVEQIFNRKCQQSQMIKQIEIVIEYGDEHIRNGRKLIKEDFSYLFNNYQGDQKSKMGNSLLEDKINTKRDNNHIPIQDKNNLTHLFRKMKTPDQKQQTPLSTERNPLTTDRILTNRSDSPSKIIDMMRRTQKFNQILLDQINKERKRFDKLDQIEQGSPQDSVYYFQHIQQQQNHYTDRSRFNESLQSFRESDLLVRADHLDTGRSQVEQLNHLLSSLDFEQESGKQTDRSKKSKNTLRINRQIKEQLYNARGSLKLQVVRRAIDRLKKEQREQKEALSNSQVNRK